MILLLTLALEVANACAARGSVDDGYAHLCCCRDEARLLGLHGSEPAQQWDAAIEAYSSRYDYEGGFAGAGVALASEERGAQSHQGPAVETTATRA